MKEIYLVRHGETEWNRLGLAQGSRNDIELNHIGIEQAEITGMYLREYRMVDRQFDIIFSSPMKRTRETAKIIAKKVGYNIDKIKYMKILEEGDHGLIAVGKTREEMREDKFYDKYFEIVQKYENIKNPIGKIDSFENFISELNEYYEMELVSEFRNRVEKFVEILKELPDGKYCVISHGGTIGEINKYILNTEIIKGDYKCGSNCHITFYRYIDGKFKLIIPPNTLHFEIYDKKYCKEK